jgi:hypothetical protein
MCFGEGEDDPGSAMMALKVDVAVVSSPCRLAIHLLQKHGRLGL